MTPTAKTIFDSHHVRKTKKQKRAFRDFTAEAVRAEGYDCHEEPGMLGARNLVVGDPETARVVFTAHYDTCARMPIPNFITPTKIGIYLFYQIAISLVILLIPVVERFVLGVAVSLLGVPMDTVAWLIPLLYATSLIAIILLMMIGPANRHTANDNTSGVITLIELMHAIPAEHRGNVAFIFFDLEETGLFGSAGYYSRHKKAMRSTLLINFDCVSDGNHILFAVRKKATPYAKALEAAYTATDAYDVLVRTKGTVYPSDQAQFPCGVGVASLKKTRRGLLYMDRIHTARDTVFQEANIAFLVEGSVRLVDHMYQDGESH